MSLVRKLGTVIEVKASAAEFHEAFSCRPDIVAITSPGNVHSCELVEGEWGKSTGSVICWTFTREALGCVHSCSSGRQPALLVRVKENRVVQLVKTVTFQVIAKGSSKP